MSHHEFDIVFVHAMIIDMRQARVCIDVVAEKHRTIVSGAVQRLAVSVRTYNILASAADGDAA